MERTCDQVRSMLLLFAVLMTAFNKSSFWYVGQVSVFSRWFTAAEWMLDICFARLSLLS